MIRKKLLAGACALLMLTGCGGEAGDALASLMGPAPNWYDSDVGELVPTDQEIRPQDDFAASVNQEFLKTGMPVGEGIYGTMSNLYDHLFEIMESDIGGSKAYDELAKYADLYNDEALLKEQGFAPLKEYIDDIASISTTDELYSFICDSQRNPLGTSVILPSEGERSKEDPDRLMVVLMGPTLSLAPSMYTAMTPADYEYKLLSDRFATYMLSHMGYDDKAIKKTLTNCYDAEKFFATHNETGDGREEADISFDRAAIAKMAKGYPILEYLDSLGYEDVPNFVPMQEILKTADSYCRAHPEKVRDYILCRYLSELYVCLDNDTLKEIKEATAPLTAGPTMSSPFDDETEAKVERFNTFVKGTVMGVACAQLYCDRYITDEARTRLTDMTNTFINEFEKILMEEEWLSDEGKQLAVDKLRNMRIHILDMDWDLVDFNELNIVPKSEGGSLVKAYADAKRFGIKLNARRLNDKFDRDLWDPRFLQINTLETNSFYSTAHNSIFILAGISIEPLYYDGISDEELLGGIGWVVGHEITHGFDKSGVNYDKDGLNEPWLPAADQARFSDMADKVGTYFSTMHPYDNCGLYNGNNVTAEAIADMGGVRLGLAAAKNIPDFDYDLYFRTCAKTWQINRSLEQEKGFFSGDSHPLSYLRVNCTCCQYNEFYETYGIQEGDGMYTEPDKRVKIW